MSDTTIVPVPVCPRCGDNHGDTVFKRLIRAAEEFKHWTMCPNTGEPIFLRLRMSGLLERLQEQRG